MIAFRLARGISDLRRQMRELGFGMPDLKASLVAVNSDGGYTVDQVHAEFDQSGATHLKDWRARPEWGPARLAFERRYGSTPDADDPFGAEPLVAQQRADEASKLVGGWPDLIQRRTELRKFAERFAATRSFKVAKRGRPAGVQRVLQKAVPGNDAWLGEIFVDAGGRFGSISSSNQMQFHITTREGDYLAGLSLSQLVPGMIYYASAQQGLAALKANRFQEVRPPELVSELIKLGVMAEITFFDLLLHDIRSDVD